MYTHTHRRTHAYTTGTYVYTHTYTNTHTLAHTDTNTAGEQVKAPFPYSLGQSVSAQSLGGHSCSIQCPGLGMCSARLLPLQTCVGKKVRSRAD